MARRPPHSDPSSIGDVLAHMLGGRSQYAVKARQYQLWSQWTAVVGEALAQHARPLRMRGKTLVVAVDTSAWLQELTLLRPQLLGKIRAHFQAALISDIQLVLDSAQGNRGE